MKNIIKVRPILNGEADKKDLFYIAPADVKVGERVIIASDTFKHGQTKIEKHVHAIVVGIENDHALINHEDLHEIEGVVGDFCRACNTIPCVCGAECEACG